MQSGQHESGLVMCGDTLTRLRALAVLARKIGGNHFDEDTKARFTAVAFHDASEADVFCLLGDDGYNFLVKFRQFHASAPVFTPGRFPHVYPTFETFETDHPNLYMAAGYTPGANKSLFSVELQQRIAALGNAIPKRTSNNNVSAAAGAVRARRGGSPQLPRALSRLNLQEVDGLQSLPGFTWLGAAQGGSSVSNFGGLRRNSSMLALQPPPAEQQQLASFNEQQQQQQLAQQQLASFNAQQQEQNQEPIGAQPQGPQEQPAQGPQQPTTKNASVADMVAAMSNARKTPTKAMKAKAPMKAMKAPTKAMKAKAPAKAAATAVAKKVKKGKGCCRAKPKSVHVQSSIQTVLARTGLDTKPKSKSFPYTSQAGLAKAKLAAHAWLKSMGV